jgi:hypothetical protein
MLKSELIEKIELARTEFEKVRPGVRDQSGVNSIKDNLHAILFSLTVPLAFKDVCREQIKLINDFCGPILYEKNDADRIRHLINQNFDRLSKIAARYDFPSAKTLR